MLARAIHREHFLLQCLKKEIATAKELDLRPLGKVIIFRDRQTDRQNLPIIYRFIEENDSKVITDFGIEYLYFCGAQAN